MKKYIYTTLLFVTPLLVSAQISGKKSDKPQTIGPFTVDVGDTIYLGKGSTNLGNFAFIEQPANYLAGVAAQNLSSRYAGKYVIVKHFKIQSDRRTGDKTFIVVNPFGGYNFSVDLLAGIDSGEIVGINGNQVGKVSPTQPQTATASVADELIKLKQLLDSGAITQSEYDQQKKKLLSN